MKSWQGCIGKEINGKDANHGNLTVAFAASKLSAMTGGSIEPAVVTKTFTTSETSFQ